MKTLTVNYPKGKMTLKCFDNFYIIEDENGRNRIEHSNKDKNELIKQLKHEINVYMDELLKIDDVDLEERIKMVIKANTKMIDFLNDN